MIATFGESKNKNIQGLINVIKENDPDNFCLVKTQKRNTVIPRLKTVDVPCRANTGPAKHKTPGLFQPSECSHLPSGLSIQEELTTVKQGNSTLLYIKATSNTEHDITLFGRTMLGHLQLVRSVTPLEVKFKDTCKQQCHRRPQRMPGTELSRGP